MPTSLVIKLSLCITFLAVEQLRLHLVLHIQLQLYLQLHFH
jgi:hypothetical protein